MKKRGFTLIELLAVIVILAIIALIATPMIMGVIDEVRKKAAESSANNYTQIVEDSPLYDSLLQTGSDEGRSTGVYTVKDLEGVKMRGEAPTNGWVAIEDGIVVAACLKFNSYNKWVAYDTKNHAQAKLSEEVKLAEQGTTSDAEYVKAAKEALNNKLNPSA